MAKSIMGGMTDYNHQSFNDILSDIEKERERTASFLAAIRTNIDILESNKYWQQSVPVGFKNIISYAIRHYDTAVKEFTEIKKDLLTEVKEHHIKRLNKIADVAQQINAEIGSIWNDKYDNQDYGNPSFAKVERIYADTRDTAVNLLDTANIAERLKDFIGRKHDKFPLAIFLTVISVIVGILVMLFGNNIYNRLFPNKETPVNQEPTTLNFTLAIYNQDFPIPKQQIILYDSLSKVVYRKTTDDDGTVIFPALEKNKKYWYSFKYSDSSYRYNVTVDGDENISRKRIVAAKSMIGSHLLLNDGDKQLFSSQGVKVRHNIIFDNINIRLNRFDLGGTAAYIQVGEQIGGKEGSILIQETKIARDNPFNFQFKGYNYVVYLVAIAYGYPTDPKTPAAVVQVSRTSQ